MTDTIHVLMGRVLAELPAIGKDDYNQQQKFHFRGIDAVLNALNPLLAKHGVFYVPEVVERQESQRQTKGGTVMYVVNLHVRYRFYGPAGDYVEASAWGEGTDMGDKATNKAMTGAMKYMLFQVFAISTQEASDGDAGPPEETVPAFDCPEACGYRASRDALREHLHTTHHWPMNEHGQVVRPKPPAHPGGPADATGSVVPSGPVARPPSEAQRRALMAASTAAYPDRDARLTWAGDVLGRRVDSFAALPAADAAALLAALDKSPAASPAGGTTAPGAVRPASTGPAPAPTLLDGAVRS